MYTNYSRMGKETMRQTTKAVAEQKFEKIPKGPISGRIFSYLIKPSRDETPGKESLVMEIETGTEIRKIFISLSQSMWRHMCPVCGALQTEVQSYSIDGDICKCLSKKCADKTDPSFTDDDNIWYPMGFTEYGRLKTAGNGCKIEFTEDINVIVDPKPKMPKVHIVDIMTAPNLVGYYIRLGIDNKNPDYPNYTVEYMGAQPEGEEPDEVVNDALNEMFDSEVVEAPVTPRVIVSKPTPVQKPVETPIKASKIEISEQVSAEFEKYLNWVTDMVSPLPMALRAIVNNRDSYDDFTEETRAFITDNVAVVIDDFLLKGKLIAEGNKYRLVN